MIGQLMTKATHIGFGSHDWPVNRGGALFACINETICDEPTSSVNPNDNRNVEFPGNYEDVGGDFKRPGAVFHKVKSLHQLGFFHGFLAAISVIIVSELGDKTFFIAVVMAMKHPRVTVFLGAMSALTIMTILSACLGFATTVIPRTYTHYISTALFAIFGLKMLKEAYDMSPDEGQEELEVVQKDLLKREIEQYDTDGQTQDIETAAREDAVGVTIGAVIGHGVCTSLAVIGGRIVAQRISVKSVTFIGAVIFLIFAVWALAIGPGT
ncbi:Transmembrane protein 165 like protein [Argiope bruennichi]|uniref:GDT1 family protein n=1 Tax=Argiope bruennichi TaxID=94029 RepID=A0A8T0FL99_ARGBR|nr:Transmembrane protein 165 like protein [Argiope bruennichi]